LSEKPIPIRTAFIIHRFIEVLEWLGIHIDRPRWLLSVTLQELKKARQITTGMEVITKCIQLAFISSLQILD
jgi:hypothetical protein